MEATVQKHIQKKNGKAANEAGAHPTPLICPGAGPVLPVSCCDFCVFGVGADKNRAAPIFATV